MKKILSRLRLSKARIIILLSTFSFLILFSIFFVSPAQAQLGIGTPNTQGLVEGQFYPDSETTFVGKTASRSAQFLDWTLQNYQWLCVAKNPDNQYLCDNTDDPLIPFWKIIRNIVYALMALFVLATAFILIITRGQNVTIMRFVPRFVFVIILVTLSFSLVQFLYQVGDVVQNFFLRSGDAYISTKDLLYMGFNYQDFKGYRVYGSAYDESAFITLLLVRLTALTYYVMTGILLIRKIILWFFIIVSPVFPLLLFYRPIRNTAKIWVGEFFRWLLYGPLFAIFLNGLVVVWRAGIPLPFDSSQIGTVVYPTSVNILLGGPGQTIFWHSPTEANSINLSDTFALYVVALLMLWVVIILPFILLKIFLDYIATLSIENNTALKTFVNKNFSFLNPPPGGASPTPPAPPPPGLTSPTGIARALPFLRGRALTPNTVSNVATNSNTVKNDIQSHVRESTSVLKLTNISIPKMRDIAKYETSMLSNNATVRNQATQMHNTLEKIANPSIVATPAEREKFTTVREQLLSQKQKGNPIATSILSASQISTATNQATKTVQTRESQITQISKALKEISNTNTATSSKTRETLIQEKQKGNQLASDILDASQKVSSTTITEEQKKKVESEVLDKLLEEEKKGNVVAKDLLPEVVTETNIQTRESQITQISNTLQEIGNTTTSSKTRETLIQEKQKGNQLASDILDASQQVASTNVTEEQKKKVENEVLDKLLAEEKKGNVIAKDILPKQATVRANGPVVASSLPSVNRVQQVSLDDYEEVRKLWTENYQSIEPPKALNGEQEDRQTWIKNDIDKITQAIALLSSPNTEQVNEGMNMVANILPFLLIGGFSKTEVVAYLKAKMEAGKSVLNDINKQQTEEDSMLSRRTTSGEGHATEAAKMERPLEENPAFKEDEEQKPGPQNSGNPPGKI